MYGYGCMMYTVLVGAYLVPTRLHMKERLANGNMSSFGAGSGTTGVSVTAEQLQRNDGATARAMLAQVRSRRQGSHNISLTAGVGGA